MKKLFLAAACAVALAVAAYASTVTNATPTGYGYTGAPGYDPVVWIEEAPGFLLLQDDSLFAEIQVVMDLGGMAGFADTDSPCDGLVDEIH